MTSSAGNLNQKIERVSWMQLFMPRIEDIIFMAIFVSVILMGPKLMNMDGDLGRHLTLGNFILENGTIPTKDIFSHSMQGLSLTPHEWLAQVSFAIVFRMAELNGVVIFSALLIALTFTLVYRHCFKRSGMLLVSLGMTVWAAAAASIHWLTRPHLFTMLITVIWIGELDNWRDTGRLRWWLLPVLMLVWVNLHGAFIVGILLWMIYLVDNLYSRWIQKPFKDMRSSAKNVIKIETRKFIMVSFTIILATLLNPAGWGIWKTTFGYLQNQYLVSHTVEYQSPNFQEISAWPFLAMVCFSILLLSFRRGRQSLVVGLSLASWTVFGLISARNIALYAVIAAPLLAYIGAEVLRENQIFSKLLIFDSNLSLTDRRLFGRLWPVLTILLIGVILIRGVNLDSEGLGNDFSKDVFPVEAVDWVLEQPDMGKMFNYFPWGGYLLYRAWPQQKVFIDGQTDFYGEILTREYERVITSGDGWQEILEKYRIDWVIMPTDSRLSQELYDHPSWRELYSDQTASIYHAVP